MAKAGWDVFVAIKGHIYLTFASQIEQLLSNSSEVIAQLPVDKTQ